MAIRHLLLLSVVSVVLASDYVAVPGGGDTICSKGTKYTFFYRKGSVNKLAVFFEGGGACWDGDSCLLPIYTAAVDVQGTLSNLNSGGGITGPDPRSPIANWSVLYIPYCTADVHAGNNTANYGLYSIHHRGRVNVEAALNYAVSHYSGTPEVAATIGCSAGSLGAFINAPYVMRAFPHSKHYVWGDSEVGIITATQWSGGWNNWHTQLAPFIPKLAPRYTKAWTPSICGDIIVSSAEFFPSSTWAAYCSDFDLVESSYYKLGGGKGDWTTLMRNQFTQVHANVTTGNIASYIASGGAHCVSDNDNYWKVKSGGVMLSDWVAGLLEGKNISHAVDCTPNCL